jgi:hypothetical protein
MSIKTASEMNIAEAIDLIREHPADILRRNPRQWGRVSEHATATAARAAGSSIRCGRWPTWGPSRSFQVLTQSEGDVFVLYARYVGGGES